MDDFTYKFEELAIELENGNADVVDEFKALIEERLKVDDPQAHIALGYAHYLGYIGFTQDYNKALASFLEALNLIDDPYVANSVGYIYYYGRTNNGIPNYEAAFYYFALGAKAGVTEAVYKLADMYYHGYGVSKNIEHAMFIYEKLYYTTLASFIESEPSKFADLCLRQASISISEHQNKLAALSYYLEADYSLKKREDEHYIGDKKLRLKTEAKIASLNEELAIKPPFKRPQYAPLNFNADVKGISNISYALECTLKPDGPAKATLTITDSYYRAFLVTLPKLNYTKLHDVLTLSFRGHVSEAKYLTFANLVINENTITVRDYVNPAVTIPFSDLQILL